ncbi:hypothetical protein FGADI_10508 [Fusarium gaditjirri]|uniref:Uncharacterized protein n=1 Tax=Fusarium gaditjirri TaxID=282569 RepID=A0A8H4WRM1_9HYPO|nr:hypothetical protein FGADI_10508 [Fusarium gaditjirri]
MLDRGKISNIPDLMQSRYIRDYLYGEWMQYRTAACINFPFWNAFTGEIEEGCACKGCYEAFEDQPMQANRPLGLYGSQDNRPHLLKALEKTSIPKGHPSYPGRLRPQLHQTGNRHDRPSLVELVITQHHQSILFKDNSDNPASLCVTLSFCSTFVSGKAGADNTYLVGLFKFIDKQCRSQYSMAIGQEAKGPSKAEMAEVRKCVEEYKAVKSKASNSLDDIMEIDEEEPEEVIVEEFALVPTEQQRWLEYSGLNRRHIRREHADHGRWSEATQLLPFRHLSLPAFVCKYDSSSPVPTRSSWAERASFRGDYQAKTRMDALSPPLHISTYIQGFFSFYTPSYAFHLYNLKISLSVRPRDHPHDGQEAESRRYAPSLL